MALPPIPTVQLSLSTNAELEGHTKTSLIDSLERMLEAMVSHQTTEEQAMVWRAQANPPQSTSEGAALALLADAQDYVSKKFFFDGNTMKVELQANLPVMKERLKDHLSREAKARFPLNAKILLWVVRTTLSPEDAAQMRKEGEDKIASGVLNAIAHVFMERLDTQVNDAVNRVIRPRLASMGEVEVQPSVARPKGL
jgi:hypothetical protein